MLFDEEREFIALSNLFAAQKKSLSMKELTALFSGNLWDAGFISYMIRALREKGYLEITDEHITIHPDGSRTESPSNVKHRMTNLGIEMYLYRVKEKGREDLDIKVKKITIGNAWLPKGALIVAGLSTIATITVSTLNYLKKDKQYIPVKEMQQLMQTQEKINKSLLEYMDSLRKNAKSPTSPGVHE